MSIRLDLTCLLAGSIENAILRIEDRCDGTVDRLSLLVLDLLRLVLGLLEPKFRIGGPLLELTEVVLELNEEGTNFSLVVTLERRGELVFFDRARGVGVLRRHRPSVSVLR